MAVTVNVAETEPEQQDAADRCKPGQTPCTSLAECMQICGFQYICVKGRSGRDKHCDKVGSDNAAPGS